MVKRKTVTILRKEPPKIKNKKRLDLEEFVKLSREVREILEKEREERFKRGYDGSKFFYGF